jgi:hypothetical protein
MTLKWSLSIKHAQSTAADVVLGKISLLDVSADGDYELQDVEVEQFNSMYHNNRHIYRHNYTQLY